MPHRTSSRGHLVGEPPHPNKRTTIGLCSDDYWYGGQTTIGFGCKPLLGCTRNYYWNESKQLLLHLYPPYCFTLESDLYWSAG